MKALSSVGAALAALLSLAAPALAKDWTTVTVATEGAYAPFNFTTSDGKIVGYEPDLLANVCAREKLTCNMVVQDFDGSIPGLQAGKFDVIMSGMSITPKRLAVIDFSIPYTNSPTTFAVVKDSPLATMPLTGVDVGLADKPAAESKLAPVRTALKGKTVGVQTATIQADVMDQFLKDGVDIRTYKANDEIALDLQAGRVDAWIGAQTNLDSVVKPARGELVYAGPLMVGGPLGMGSGFGLRKTDPELKAKLDDGLKAAIADGTAKTLSMKWFGFDVVPR